MAQPSWIANAPSATAIGTVSGRAYTSAELSRLVISLGDYERITGNLTRRRRFIFDTAVAASIAGSGPLIEMRAQLVDRGEAHHAFRHLGLDRAVGIERIGHAIDDARFQDRRRRLIAIVRAGAALVSSNVKGVAAPRRRISPGRASVSAMHCRTARAAARPVRLPAWRAAQIGPPLRTFALFPRRRREQQIALRLGSRRWWRHRVFREHGLGNRVIAQDNLILPWWRGNRRSAACLRRDRLIAAGQENAFIRRQDRPDRGFTERLRRARAEPARDVPQFPDRRSRART